MADDDKDNESGVDPWAGIESGSSPDLEAGFSFSFDDAVEPGAGEPDAAVEGAGTEPPAESTPTVSGEALAPDATAVDPDDDLVNSWLDDEADAAPAATGPLGVFAPEDETAADAFAGQSSIQIGTGESGAHSPSSIEALGFVDAEGESSPAGSQPMDDFPAWGTAGDDAPPAEEFPRAADDAPGVVGEEIFASGGETAETDSDASMFAGVGDDAAVDADAGEAGADVIDFASAAATGATAAAATAVTRPAGKLPRTNKKKSGGLGQMLGVVLGGALAIPIVLGILIGLMWLGWKDTIGIRRMMPTQLAFLLPPKRAAAAAGGSLPDLSQAPTLDDLTAAVTDVATAVATPPSDESASPEPSSSGEPSEPTGDEPKPEPGAEPDIGPDAAATAVAPAPTVPADPAAAAAVDDPLAGLLDVKPAAPESKDSATAPAADPLAGLLDATPEVSPAVPTPPSAPPAPPPPPPLDTAALENAVAEAAASLAALDEAVEPAENDRERLLVDWYKSLARVAEEYTALEAVALDSGRPLAGAPDQVIALHDGIVAKPERVADLTRLARNWLDYGRRGSEGIVVPATFGGARKVGPYWCAKVTLEEPAEGSRSLAVISRAEPAAAPGELVVITGLTLDGAVVWAADIRAAKPAADDRDDADETPPGDEPAVPAGKPAADDPLAGLLGDDEPAKPETPAEPPRREASGLDDAAPPPADDPAEPPQPADSAPAPETKPESEPESPSAPAPSAEPPATDGDASPATDPDAPAAPSADEPSGDEPSGDDEEGSAADRDSDP